MPERAGNERERPYAARTSGAGASAIVTPSMRRSGRWLLVILLALSIGFGLWLEAREGRARRDVARGDGVPGSFVLEERLTNISPRGGPTTITWRGEFTSADGSTERVAWLSDPLTDAARPGDVVEVVWSSASPDAVFLPGAAGYEEWWSDLIGFFVLATVVWGGSFWWSGRRREMSGYRAA